MGDGLVCAIPESVFLYECVTNSAIYSLSPALYPSPVGSPDSGLFALPKLIAWRSMETASIPPLCPLLPFIQALPSASNSPCPPNNKPHISSFVSLVQTPLLQAPVHYHSNSIERIGVNQEETSNLRDMCTSLMSNHIILPVTLPLPHPFPVLSPLCSSSALGPFPVSMCT